jgi:hypothetical protein
MSQHFRYKLRKPFKFEYDPKYPTFEEYIVFVGKRPYEQKYVDYGDKGFSYISKFEWTVVIDLWIIAMRFRWIGREQNAKA